MDDAVKIRLLQSIEAGRLVLLLGAGLSMAPPSSLPSAAVLADRCFQRYTTTIDPTLNPALQWDLEALSEHFFAQGTLEAVFINSLVPWADFVRPPNPGHAAIADFLLTKAAHAGLSANYDPLIERRAEGYGAAFNAAIDGNEANVFSQNHAPLLKYHGCGARDRNNTVWTRSQLTQPVLAARIQTNTVWIGANLMEKDLLVVGFWSDWAYFNDIIGRSLANVNPASVTLVDPSDIAVLEAKAPALWALAHKAGVHFTHVQQSGAEALDELRRAFSEGFMRQVLDAGRTEYAAHTGVPWNPALLTMTAFDAEALYGLRRDAEGVRHDRPATLRKPANSQLLGFFHLLLRGVGAVQTPFGYEFGGRRIRVVNGAGRLLDSMKRDLMSPPALPSVDIVAAVGAHDLGVPAHIMRGGTPGHIVRTAPVEEWLDLDGARTLLGI